MRSFILSSMLLCLSLITQAQGSISGKVSNSNEEVMYASVALLNLDSSLVKGAITSLEGDYTLEKIVFGTYLIKVDHIEHETYFSNPIILNSSSSSSIQNIELAVNNNVLGEVVVSFRKPLIEVKADRLVFNVSSSPSASGTNGFDLLKQAPGINIDMDSNISLLGKSGVQIYINGIRSRLSGDDLVTFLESISSDNIEAIDIISNPSSKYDAEGSAGVIDIKMKTTIIQGFNGVVNSSFTQGELLRYRNSIILNYGREKFKSNIEVTQSKDNRFDNFLDTKVQNSNTLDLDSREDNIRDALNVSFGFEANITDDQTLNLSARSVLNQGEDDLVAVTDIFSTSPKTLNQILESKSLVDRKSTNNTLNLNYRWTISDESNLSSAMSYGRFTSENNTFQPNTLFDRDASTILLIDNTAFDANTDIDIFSAKLDYDREWENMTFSVGAKFSNIETDNQFDFYTVLDEDRTFDSSRSNDFRYRESVTALYAILNAKLLPAVSLNAGLRMEHTDSRGQLLSEASVDNKDVPRTYTNLFPNVSLSFDNQGEHALSLSVGRRITRPNYQDLNPFETPVSQLTVWKGNPFLRPNYIMNYQASYSYKQKLIITNAYSVTSDFFANLLEIVGENGTQIIPRNMDEVKNYGLSASYPIDVTKFWSFNTFLEGAYQTFNGELEGIVIDIEATTYSLRSQHFLKLPWEMTMDLTYYLSSDWVWRGSIDVQGNQSLGFGIRKYFLDKKLQLRVTGADVFRTTNDYFYNGSYGGLDIDGVRSFDSQRFGMGLSWKFGNQKIKTGKSTKGALDDELNRIDN